MSTVEIAVEIEFDDGIGPTVEILEGEVKLDPTVSASPSAESVRERKAPSCCASGPGRLKKHAQREIAFHKTGWRGWAVQPPSCTALWLEGVAPTQPLAGTFPPTFTETNRGCCDPGTGDEPPVPMKLPTPN